VSQPKPIQTDLLVDVVHELMEAEAAYRSAMKVYKDHPLHRTRLSAESRWYWAKVNVKSVLNGARRAPGEETK
jgi:hypothetical protein